MDMFTGDMENWLKKVEVDDEHHAQLLREIVSGRDFSDHTDTSNVGYAFEVVSWVANHFEYLTYARSDEIEGERLPIALKALIAHEWLPSGELHVLYPSGSSISLALQTEKHPIQYPSRLGRIITGLITEGKSFQEIIAEATHTIENDTSLIEEHAMLSDTATLESAKVDWHHPHSANSGLLLELDGTHVHVLPYGEPHIVSRLLPLVTGFDEGSTELAVLATEFAILAAEHCPPRISGYFTEIEEIENFTQRVANI